MTPALALRAAQANDHADILRLNRESEHFLSPMGPDRLRLLLSMAAYCQVAVASGEVAAFLLAFREGAAYDSDNYRWFAARYPVFVYVDRVVVDDRFRGRGLGAMLYANLFEFAEGQGAPCVTCEFDVEPPNAVSAGFHARFGFREVGSQWVASGTKRVSLQEAPVPPVRQG